MKIIFLKLFCTRNIFINSGHVVFYLFIFNLSACAMDITCLAGFVPRVPLECF